MFSCKKATELISRSLDQKLGFIERTGLLLHKLMCGACRNFEKQLGFINRILKFKDFGISDQRLSNEVKNRIVERIERK